MRHVRTLFVLLALAPFAALAAPASADPCNPGCGKVTVVTDCLTTTVTAEGFSTWTNTQWRFVVREGGYTWSDGTDETSTGSTAQFQYASIVRTTGYYHVQAYLYANGELVDSESWACI